MDSRSNAILYTASCIMIGVLLCSGCTKNTHTICDEHPVEFGDSTNVIGTWALNSSVNGQTGLREIYLPCNGTKLVFTERTYKMYRDDSLYRTGIYEIFPDTFITQRRIQERIVFDKDSVLKQFINNNGTRLSLDIDGYDAPSTEYVRIK